MIHKRYVAQSNRCWCVCRPHLVDPGEISESISLRLDNGMATHPPHHIANLPYFHHESAWIVHFSGHRLGSKLIGKRRWPWSRSARCCQSLALHYSVSQQPQHVFHRNLKVRDPWAPEILWYAINRPFAHIAGAGWERYRKTVVPPWWLS